MPFKQIASTWLRLTFRWSNSIQTWHERVGDLVLVAGAVIAATITILTWYDFVSLPWWSVPLVWLVCLLPSFALNRLGWLKVFGPVLYYDIIRQARRSRFILLRVLYIGLLIFLLFNVSLSVTTRFDARADARQGATIAEAYFYTFMLVQFITVVLLTPAYVGGAIAEEKDRKTLEFMLATDLLNREIVLSKVGSRLCNLSLLVLAGLPILSVLQFLGGVDPNLVLAGFVVTAMTIFGQAGVSILCSVVSRKPREAIALAYLGVVLYYVLSEVLNIGLGMMGPQSFATYPIWFGEGAPTVADALDLFNKGNLRMLVTAVMAAGFRGSLASTLPPLIRDYCLFQALLGGVCIGLAVARLRRVALHQTYGTPIKAAKSRFSLWGRPAVGNLPMLWKELNCEGGSRGNWLSYAVFTLLLAATFIPAGLIVYDSLANFYRPVYRGDNLGMRMNVWLRTSNVIVGSLVILAVAVRASNAVSSERDRQTMDTLLTTPLDSTSILHSKWVASLFGARLGLLWLTLIWAVGIVTGGMHILALPLVMLAWLVYASFAATLGSWFSVVCKTSMRATVLTVLCSIFLAAGHWLLWLCCIPIFIVGRGPGRGIETLAQAHLGVLTPPFVMGFVPFSISEAQDLRGRAGEGWLKFMAFSILGLVVWTVATAFLYGVTAMRFRAMTNRQATMQPDSPGYQPPRPRPLQRRRDPDEDDDSEEGPLVVEPV